MQALRAILRLTQMDSSLLGFLAIFLPLLVNLSLEFKSLRSSPPAVGRHDNQKLSGEQLTSQAFVRNLKLYARAALLGDVHLHQTRHTFARLVTEETDSISATRHALDNQ